MSLIEAQAGLTDLLPCNEFCGGDYSTYSFTQNDQELQVIVPIPPGTTSKQVSVEISTTRIFVGLKMKGVPPVLQGDLFKPIKASESSWSIEDRQRIVVTIVKANLQYEEWWPHVVTTERQIDMKTLRPPSKHIRELDESTQATVAKMMFDQEQKRKGLPTSDELKMQELLQKPHATSIH